MNIRGDENGHIWCLGTDVAKLAEGQDYDLVHRFDASGKSLGRSLARSTYPDTPSPLSIIKRHSGYGGFLPGAGTIRLWLPAVEELITFDTDGRVLDRLVLPTVEHLIRARLVTAPDDEVYAILTTGKDIKDSDTWTHGLYRWTHDGASWTPLHDPPVQLPLRITLNGADQEGLILLDRRSLDLLWYPLASDGDQDQRQEAAAAVSDGVQGKVAATANRDRHQWQVH